VPDGGESYNPGIMTEPLSQRLSPRIPLCRTPLVPAALALIGGIVAGRLAPLPDVAWFLWAALAVVASAVCLSRKWTAAAGVSIAAAIFALGAVHLRLDAFRVDEDHVVTYAGRTRTLATLRGRVVSSPSVYRQGNAMAYPREPVTRFDVAADAIRTRDGWRGTEGLVAVSVLQEASALRRGQTVELVGWLSRIGPRANPGERDQAAAARRAGKLVAFRVPVAEGAKVLAASSGWWARRLADRASLAARGHLSRCASRREALILEALVLGRRDPALTGLREAMAHAGIVHLLSISGMHLGILLGFVYLLCRLATLGPRLSAAAALVCLSGYLLLAEPRSPLLRSAVMAGAVCAGAIVYRHGGALNALAASAGILLVADPQALFSPAFQLSFTIVAGLVVLSRPLGDVLFGRWVRERGLMVFRREHRVRRWLYYNAANWAMGGATMSLLAWLLAAPLAAYHFGLFSPYGAVLTALAVPLVVAALVPTMVSLALAWFVPNLSHAIGRAGAAGAAGLAAFVEAIEQLPGLHVELRPVTVPWVAACYAGITVVVFHRRIPRGRAVACAAAGLVLALTVHTQRAAPPANAAELHVLAVGAGQCAVLTTPGGTTCLLDAGSTGRADCGERILAPFIRHGRLRPPTIATISHANADHYNALGSVVRRGWLDRVVLSEYFGRGDLGAGAGAIETFLAMLRTGGVRTERLGAGRTIRLDARTVIEVLWPPAGKGELSANDRSLVLKVTCDGRSVLVPGDLSEVGQTGLLASGRSLRSDVLIMPHHGAWSKTLPAFLEAVSPRHVVVSAGHAPRPPVSAGPAARAFYENLARDERYHCTHDQGYIHVRFGGEGVSVEPYRP